nr:hypothetical protein Q903MT_gene5397 [Picea sitchensis]
MISNFTWHQSIWELKELKAILALLPRAMGPLNKSSLPFSEGSSSQALVNIVQAVVPLSLSLNCVML